MNQGELYNQRYMGRDANTVAWTKELIEDYRAQCANGTLPGSYEVFTTTSVRDMLPQANVKGGRVLVIGSERPWIEACLLERGAKEVVTIEYGGIKSSHPQVGLLACAAACLVAVP